MHRYIGISMKISRFHQGIFYILTLSILFMHPQESLAPQTMIRKVFRDVRTNKKAHIFLGLSIVVAGLTTTGIAHYKQWGPFKKTNPFEPLRPIMHGMMQAINKKMTPCTHTNCSCNVQNVKDLPLFQPRPPSEKNQKEEKARKKREKKLGERTNQSDRLKKIEEAAAQRP